MLKIAKISQIIYLGLFKANHSCIYVKLSSIDKMVKLFEIPIQFNIK